MVTLFIIEPTKNHWRSIRINPQRKNNKKRDGKTVEFA